MIIITNLTDGTAMDVLWGELQASTDLRNRRRTALEALLSTPVTVAAEALPTGLAGDLFERASEYGEPVGARFQPDLITLGYPFEWYDVAERYTFRFLADATAEQVRAVHNAVLEGDVRLVYGQVMAALFQNTQRVSPEGNIVYSLWAGAAGDSPPSYLNNTFATGHNHYLTTGGVLEGVDLELAIRHVTHHGYGTTPGSRLLVLANEQEADIIRSFRAGQVAADGSKSRWDFIPGAAAPAFLSPAQIIGDQAPSVYENLPLIGSLGPAYIVEESNVPPGYLLIASTGGSDSGLNAVALRSHSRPELRGLKLVGGTNPAYPIADAIYGHGLGCGVRARSAAAVLQVTAGAYVPPAQFPVL